MIVASPSREIRPSEHFSALGGLTPNTEARGFPVDACAPPTGLPVLLLRSSCTHAAAHTPAEATGHNVRAHWRYRSLAAFPVTPAGRPPH